MIFGASLHKVIMAKKRRTKRQKIKGKRQQAEVKVQKEKRLPKTQELLLNLFGFPVRYLYFDLLRTALVTIIIVVVLLAIFFFQKG